MPQLHYNLGNALRNAGAPQRALASFRRAIELAPDFALAYNNLGSLLHGQGHDDVAERWFAEAVRIDPRLGEAHFNLGVVRQKKHDLPGAERAFRAAIEAGHAPAAAHYNLGCIARERDCWDEAAACYRQSLAHDPCYADSLCSLGTMRYALGDDDGAMRLYNAALEAKADCAEAHYGRGMLLLKRREFAAGWPEYEWHLRLTRQESRASRRPAWDGSPLANRTILIHCDYGLGDTIHFLRYLPWVRSQGAGEILLAAQRSLHPLVARLPDPPRLVSRDDPSLEYDVHASVVSLPALAGTTAASIPSSVPYLSADPRLVAHWRDVLGRYEGLKVGICWQGSPQYGFHLRSVPLAHFRPLTTIPGVRLISLQLGPGRQQLAECDERSIVDFGEDLDRDSGPFMDTAAIIENLDLVICCDTAIGHLAGRLRLRYGWHCRWERNGVGSRLVTTAHGTPRCDYSGSVRPGIGRKCSRGSPRRWNEWRGPHDRHGGGIANRVGPPSRRPAR